MFPAPEDRAFVGKRCGTQEAKEEYTANHKFYIGTPIRCIYWSKRETSKG